MNLEVLIVYARQTYRLIESQEMLDRPAPGPTVYLLDFFASRLLTQKHQEAFKAITDSRLLQPALIASAIGRFCLGPPVTGQRDIDIGRGVAGEVIHSGIHQSISNNTSQENRPCRYQQPSTINDHTKTKSIPLLLATHFTV